MANLPPPGPVAKRALADALLPETLSIRETGGNNKGKWIAAILSFVHLAVGNPWCLAFVITRLVKAARELELTIPDWVPITGYTPTFANAAKKRGLWIPVADAQANPGLIKPGDLVFFWGNVSGVFRVRHVGIVKAVFAWGVSTVEGNTGPEKAGTLNRDGDGVFEKERNWSELGTGGGFVRLTF